MSAVKAKAAPKSLTTAPKKKVARAPSRRSGKKSDPSFEGWEKWSPAEYGRKLTLIKGYYYETYTLADFEQDIWDWMKNNGYTANDIKSAKAAGISVWTGIYCRLLQVGMPDYHAEYATWWEALPGTSGKMDPTSAWIKKKINEAVEKGKSIVIEEKKTEKKKKDVVVPSIQERMKETALSMTDDIEAAIDSFMSDPNKFDPASFKIAAMLRGKEAKAGHARIIKSQYERELEEYKQLTAAGCPNDLMAGYSSYGKKNIKKMFDFLNQIVSACDQIAGEAKIVRRPRKIKVKSPEDQTKKIKFKASDDRYGIASIPPANIIGATTLIVFNTKTRKIGVYYADQTNQVLSVKGTTIVGFDEQKSQQKTLRKPDIQLKEFKAITTQKKAQTWFDGIKTTNTTLNGRINNDVMILKAYK